MTLIPPACLADLEEQVVRDLSLTDYPARDWVIGRSDGDGHVYDVAIVGAGQGGLAAAFGLMRERVTNIVVVDQSAAGAEGPWVTFARMITLRTPKHITGPDLGIPSLTFRSWFEAQHGAAAWDELGKIPKEQWMAYLVWYRRLLGIPVENGVRASAVETVGGLYRLRVDRGGVAGEIRARKVVLATGIEGSGVWSVPRPVREGVAPERYAHTNEAIDFAALRGKRIGVLGAGASAFDNAATALENGAARVDLFYRRRELPVINPYRWMEFSGFLRHYADLDDARRWRFMNRIFTQNQPPPADTFERCRRHGNFHLHGNAGWDKVAEQGGAVGVEAGGQRYEFDFLIIGTGFLIDLALRPEMAGLAAEIATWADRYTPPAGELNPVLASYPYLGPSFEHLPKLPGTAPHLDGLFNFTFGATLSLGISAGAITGMKFGIPKLVAGITRQLFLEGADQHYDSLVRFDEPELDPLWSAA
jgi:cation diffusion facilitator CzcD-associated flavoprotein CzcO